MPRIGLRVALLLFALSLLLSGCAPAPTLAPTAVPTVAKPAAAAPTSVPALAPTSVPPTVAPAAQATGAATAGKVEITWWGQSTFVLSSSTGLKALLDPTNASTGYQIPAQEGMDVVTLSHEHGDHNNVALATGSPLVLRGLAGNEVAKIDQEIKGARVRSVATFHDDTQGAARGKNAVFVYEVAGLRVAHLGDLGHVLSAEQVQAIGIVDVALIPVGGFYTVDGKGAAEVVNQLAPRVIIPMHYKTPDLGASLSGRLAEVGAFTAALGSTATVTEAGHTVTLEAGKLPAGRTVLVMKYK